MKIKKVFLFYPPGPQYQRGEDRSQGNVDNSTSTSMRAPNDMGYVSSQLDQKNIENIFTDYAAKPNFSFIMVALLIPGCFSL